MVDQVKEYKFNNATIRIHIPDRTKEEQKEMVRKAAEPFLKKVMMEKAGEGNGRKNKCS